jgi:hypothetical protein
MGINNPDLIVGASIQEDDNREDKNVEGIHFDACSIDINMPIAYNTINMINWIYISYVKRTSTS